MGPDNPATSVTINETLPSGMVLEGSISCSTGLDVQNSTGFSWSGMVDGSQDETCTYTARVTGFAPVFTNSANYTDRDGSWITNSVLVYWIYKIFLTLVLN
ncbi:MAG: DUF11 domain-containing protein [Anaerolineaceae bacterium]|nr:DUF11 domain-containing protein [Anaerolineaceae bacterium]